MVPFSSLVFVIFGPLNKLTEPSLFPVTNFPEDLKNFGIGYAWTHIFAAETTNLSPTSIFWCSSLSSSEKFETRRSTESRKTFELYTSSPNSLFEIGDDQIKLTVFSSSQWPFLSDKSVDTIMTLFSSSQQNVCRGDTQILYCIFKSFLCLK